MSEIFAALEIGTSRTVLAVGESAPGGRIKLIRKTEIPSSGIRKSQITRIDQASASIKSVLKKAETAGDGGETVSVANAYLVVSGQHIRADRYQGTAQIAGGKVGDAAIDAVDRSARSMVLPEGRELLDIASQAYGIDSLDGILSPKGISGRIIKLDALHIHADKHRIDDARTAAASAHLEIREPVFAAGCAGDAVLGAADRRNGALVLDLGGGSTGIAAYSDGYLAYAGIIGVGGDHVTNDIAHAFDATHAQAEELKTVHGSAILSANEELGARIKMPGTSALMESRTISRRALNTVINARVKELFAIVRSHLESAGVLQLMHGGVFLTGGGAALNGIDAFAQRELGLATRTGVPLHVDGLGDERHPESYAAITGALMYAQREEAPPPSLIRSIFGGFMK